MPAQLISLNDGPNILLDKPIMLVGRHPECDIQLDSRKVSRRHCCIAQVKDYLIVRDLGSTNGVRVNGRRVVEGRLNNKDELTIGGSSYQVRWDDAAGDSPPAAPKHGHVGRPEPAPQVQPPPNPGFDSCDEPVALAEPMAAVASHSSGLGKKSEKPAKQAREAPPDIPPPDLAARHLQEEPSSHIVPERLDLRPNSDRLS